MFPGRSRRCRVSFCPRLCPDATNLQNNTLETSEDKRLPQIIGKGSLFSFFRTLSGCCCYYRSRAPRKADQLKVIENEPIKSRKLEEAEDGNYDAVFIPHKHCNSHHLRDYRGLINIEIHPFIRFKGK